MRPVAQRGYMMKQWKPFTLLTEDFSLTDMSEASFSLAWVYKKHITLWSCRVLANWKESYKGGHKKPDIGLAKFFPRFYIHQHCNSVCDWLGAALFHHYHDHHHRRHHHHFICYNNWNYYTSDSLWKIWLVESIQSIHNCFWTSPDKCNICCRYCIYHVKFNVCLITKPLGVFSSETKWLNASLVSEDELCEKCIIKQLLNSVFAWYHELSKPRVCVICLITQTSVLIIHDIMLNLRKQS